MPPAPGGLVISYDPRRVPGDRFTRCPDYGPGGDAAPQQDGPYPTLGQITWTWSDAERVLTLEPGTQPGVQRPEDEEPPAVRRDFLVTLPDGTSKDVTYRGARLVSF